MGKFAVVIMLPDDPDNPMQANFATQEFDSWGQIATALARVDREVPNWQLVTFCHVEDLPKLMEPSPGATSE